MPTLIPVQYGRLRYPDTVEPELVEVPGHFDKETLPYGLARYSLHTEYSAGPRRLTTGLLKKFHCLANSHSRNVPMLWTSSEWAVQFAQFVIELVGHQRPPEIVEVHPPFKQSCPTMKQFLDLYRVFESALRERFPDVRIVLENRSGGRGLPGRFLVSAVADILEIAETIVTAESKLTIVLDIPQVFTAERLDTVTASTEKIQELMMRLKPAMSVVTGLHLWGSTLRGGSHGADLNENFGYRQDVKTSFVRDLHHLFDDDRERYFVPEINSGRREVLESIVRDLMEGGFEFGKGQLR